MEWIKNKTIAWVGTMLISCSMLVLVVLIDQKPEPLQLEIHKEVKIDGHWYDYEIENTLPGNIIEVDSTHRWMILESKQD